MPVVLDILTHAFLIGDNSCLQDSLGCVRPARTYGDVTPKNQIDLVGNRVRKIESNSTLSIGDTP